jgi:hypothetical protein
MSPTDHDDVSKTITIKLSAVVVGKPKASITAVRAPAEAGYGTLIHIEADLKNIGDGAGKLYAYIKDADTNSIVGSKTYTASLDVNGTATLAWDLSMPNKDWNLIVWAGHVE